MRREDGQAIVLAVLMLTALLGMAALVLDVGAWFRAQRATQATADAAALAAAQALPEDPGLATALASEYANKNGGGADEVRITTGVLPNDTVRVHVKRTAPGLFSRLFGIDSVSVGAHAKARAGTPSAARWVAPIVVNEQHPMLQCAPPPCADATEIELMDLHKPGSGNAAGAFGLINLDQSAPGNIGAEVLGAWILRGFDAYMELGNYRSSPSTEFNSSHIKNALSLRIGDELLFPIYRSIEGSGQTARYDVIGWVGFVPTKFVASGSTGTVYGSFRRVIWEAIASQSAATPNFGVRAVSLVE